MSFLRHGTHTHSSTVIDHNGEGPAFIEEASALAVANLHHRKQNAVPTYNILDHVCKSAQLHDGPILRQEGNEEVWPPCLTGSEGSREPKQSLTATQVSIPLQFVYWGTTQ